MPQYGDILLEALAIKSVRDNDVKRKLMPSFILYRIAREVRRITRRHRVGCIIGFGGLVTFPGGLVTKLSDVPIVIHEQGAAAGLSNRQLSH